MPSRLPPYGAIVRYRLRNLVFCQLPLDFERANHLPQLCMNRSRPPRLQQARQLHGDGGAAGHDVAAGDQLKRGATQGERIDAGVGAESAGLHRPAAI